MHELRVLCVSIRVAGLVNPKREDPVTTTTKTSRGQSGVREEARADQATRHAERAKTKVSERRARLDGASGWIADRAGQWSLDGPDWDFMEAQKYLWNPLMDFWFRMEIDGWENIPEPPVL